MLSHLLQSEEAIYIQLLMSLRVTTLSATLSNNPAFPAS